MCKIKKILPSPENRQYVVKGILCDTVEPMLPAGDKSQTTISTNAGIIAILKDSGAAIIWYLHLTPDCL